MKAYVLCDLEGTAGVSSFTEEAFATGRYYERAVRLATLELNAVVEGLVAAGVEEVDAFDGHGAGGIDPELLHPACRLIHGRPIAVPWGLDGSYDAFLQVGAHAMAGTQGAVLAHTQSSTAIVRFVLKDAEIGELGMNFALAGYFGVPGAFLSGDRAACEEARACLRSVETVAVKQALPGAGVVSLAPARAREELRAGAQRAIKSLKKMKPLVLKGPFCLEIEWETEKLAKKAGKLPGWERTGARLATIETDDYLDLLRVYCGQASEDEDDEE